MTSLTKLPTELLEQIISHFDSSSLLNCLYQDRQFFSLIIPLVWKNLGECYWKSPAQTRLRWLLISKTLSSSKNNTFNYAIFVQKIDLSCDNLPDFRVSKQTLHHLLVNGVKLNEITFQYRKESPHTEPFECLTEINSLSFMDSHHHHHHDDHEPLQISTPPTTPSSSPYFSSFPSSIGKVNAPIRKVTMELFSVSPTLIISLFSKYINTLEELTLKVVYELNPLSIDDLRTLVQNNQKLKYMGLFTLQGTRVLDEEKLGKFRSKGELPEADYWWTDGII